MISMGKHMDDSEFATAGLPHQRAPKWFASVLTIAKQELRQLVYTPLILIFQSWFLLALSILVFIVAGFFSTNLATFDLLWTFLPWVSIVLIPALAMSAFIESIGDRGFELTFSFPVPVSAIVIGKWMAGSLVLLLTLLMTAPFIITIAYMGSPDWGRAFSGYIGGVLLLTSFYSVALLAASMTKDQVIAYILGLSSLTVLLLLGWDVAARAMDGIFPDWIVTALIQTSPNYWLNQLSEGQIQLASIVYFILLISVCLGLSICIIERRRTDNKISASSIPVRIFYTCCGFASFVFLTTSISYLPGALDMTQEKEFTLHPETVQIVDQTPNNIKIDFYYNQDESVIPASIRQHARRVRNLIGEIANRSNGKISVTLNRTQPDDELEERALISGIRSIPMTSGDQFILGAVFKQKGRENVISYFDEQRSPLLEYDLALVINSLNRKKTPRIGILSPLLKSSNIDTPREGFVILEEIKQQYDVTIIPHFSDKLPDDLDVLVVIDAPVLKRSMLLSIDQHVMANRGLISILDPYPRFNRKNAQISPQPSEEINDISDVLAAYGAVYQGPIVIGDSDLGTLVVGSDGKQLNYPFWLRAQSSSMSLAHGVTASLNELLFAEAGSFLMQPETSNFDGLIATGKKSGSLSRENFKTETPELLAAQFKPDDAGGHFIAVALRGKVKSAFSRDDHLVDTTNFMNETKSANVFAVADADWLFNPMAVQVVTNGGRELLRPLNDNIAFMLNMIEFASGDPRLLGIRSRGRVQRSFTKVAQMLRSGSERYKAQEADYVTRIENIESKISEVLNLTGAESVEQLPDNLQVQIKDLRKNVLSFRRDLREIRRKMREDVEWLEFKITVFNILGGPVLAIVFAGLMWKYRRRKAVKFAA